MIDKLYRVFQKNGINIAKDDFVYGDYFRFFNHSIHNISTSSR